MPNVFAVSIFFICFRECLETSIIVSVLLAFLKQTLGPNDSAVVHKRLVRQVWWGVGLGVSICLVICAAVISVFYTAGKDVFDKAEYIWEGAFGILASLIITIMGAALLRVSKLQDKWRVKISKVLEEKDKNSAGASKGMSGRIFGKKMKLWMEKYAMFILPFVTVLREGIEAILFIAGVGVGLPATSFPLPVLCGIGTGALVGYLIYKGGNQTSLQFFLIGSTCFLYLVAAGLFSKGVWNLEMDRWVKLAGEGVAEAGSGAGSYDIRKSVWHVDCCSPQDNGSGGWGIFNSLFGWQSSATYGSVLSYNLYWVAVIVGFLFLSWKESREVAAPAEEVGSDSETASGHGEMIGKKMSGEGNAVGTAVREVK